MWRGNFGFSIIIDLHQDSALSPFFLAVQYEKTRSTQGDAPWGMLFNDDIVLVDETKEG